MSNDRNDCSGEEVTSELKPETGASSNSDRSFARFKFLLYAEVGGKGLTKENHLKRLQSLRKELNFLKETEWQFDPIEKHIGQA